MLEQSALKTPLGLSWGVSAQWLLCRCNGRIASYFPCMPIRHARDTPFRSLDLIFHKAIGYLTLKVPLELVACSICVQSMKMYIQASDISEEEQLPER